MSRRVFDGQELERAVYLANTMFHQGSSVQSIARQLGCSWATADKLIVYSSEKWEERKNIIGELPLHFEECLSVA